MNVSTCESIYKMAIYMITRRFRAYNTWAINLAIIPSVIRFNRTRQRHANVYLCVWSCCINSILNLYVLFTMNVIKMLYLNALEHTYTAEWCCNSTIKQKWIEVNWIELNFKYIYELYNVHWIYCEIRQWRPWGKSHETMINCLRLSVCLLSFIPFHFFIFYFSPRIKFYQNVIVKKTLEPNRMRMRNNDAK